MDGRYPAAMVRLSVWSRAAAPGVPQRQEHGRVSSRRGAPRPVEARLKGSATVRLSGIDARSGERISHYSVRMKEDEPNWFSTRTIPILEDGDHPPAGVLIDGLLPIDQVLIISSPNRADCYLP